ncbi:MAG: hypothetical protein D6736_08675, partial [Nitrospinota bacterium]
MGREILWWQRRRYTCQPASLYQKGILLLCLLLSLCLLDLGGGEMLWASELRRIVTFQEQTPAAVQEEIIRESGSEILQRIPLLNAIVIMLPGERAAAALEVLTSHPEVESVVVDSALSAQSEGRIQGSLVTPVEDPELVKGGYTWNLRQIYLDAVKGKEGKQGGKGVAVAILDTGIDPFHPDLAGVVKGGYDARAGEEASDYIDRNGHGTSIAGIIAAKAGRKHQKQVMRGIAPAVTLYGVRVLDDAGGGFVSDLINGLSWVYEHPEIRVVNMSLGFYQGNDLLYRIVRMLYEAGVVMVASVGNSDTHIGQSEGADSEGADSEGADSEGADSRFCVSTAASEGADSEGADSEGADSGQDCG